MPLGESNSELIPNQLPENSGTHPELSTPDLKQRMAIAKVTYETALNSPQFGDSIRETAEDYEAIAVSLFRAVADGEISPEEASAFLGHDRAIASEAANMDVLSETYRRSYLEQRLDKQLSVLQPDQTMRLDFYDLVNFKNVNDELTMRGGDRVLAEAAREFRARHPRGTGGRIGDEFVYFQPVAKSEVMEGPPPPSPDDMPDLLTKVPVRGGSSISVYLHHGIAFYDPAVDFSRTEVTKNERGEEVREVITPAKSLINRADQVTQANKEANKAAHPELYLPRQGKIE